MFVFTFERALFKFNAATPALAPLFQLPNRIGRRDRSHYTCFAGCAPSRWDLIQPPNNLPTSLILSIHRVYFL